VKTRCPLRLPISWCLVLFALFASIEAKADNPADRVKPCVADVLTPLQPGAVHLGGHLGAQIDLCLHARIGAQDVDELVTPFRERRDQTEWRSEFWGKWITSAIDAWRYSGNSSLGALDERAVAELLRTQTPDGYIGAYPNGGHLQRWDVWGRKYVLLGLLSWQEATGDAGALDAARREADFLIGEVGPGRAKPFTNDMWNGMATSSVLEPMILLYRRTGDARYLEFANYIVGEWPTPEGPDLLRKARANIPVFQMFPGPAAVVKEYSDGGHSKAYEMMSCFEGLAELYRTTGNPDYLDAVTKVFSNIRDNEITVIGSGSDWERWHNGNTRQTEPWVKGMETCVTVTWMKLAGQMLRITGDPAYADEIERSTYNALLGAQAPDGSWWCSHSPLEGMKERAPEQCGLHQNCCVANGPRGLMLVPQLAVMKGAAGPVVNYYGAMKSLVPLPAGGNVDLEQDSDYPLGDTIRIRIGLDKPRTFVLRLRIPAWSERNALAIDGASQAAPVMGTYASLDRMWRDGDLVVLQLDMRPRVVRAPGHPEYAAIMRGPLVLARDARLERGSDVNAPVALKTTGDGRVDGMLAESPASKGIWQVFDLPIGKNAAPLRLCDFSSSGNTWDATSAYRVWMPLANLKARDAQSP
jgi:hypothetical protein